MYKKKRKGYTNERSKDDMRKEKQANSDICKKKSKNIQSKDTIFLRISYTLIMRKKTEKL